MKLSPLQKRIAADVLLLCIIYWFPWWVAVIIASAFSLFFNQYYELLFTGLIIDFLYNTKISQFGGFQFMISILCLLIFVVFLPIKSRLRLNDN